MGLDPVLGPVLRASAARRAALLAAVPTIATVAIEWAGLWSPGNVIRALAGVPLGGVVALVVMNALHYDECAPLRPIEPKPPPPSI